MDKEFLNLMAAVSLKNNLGIKSYGVFGGGCRERKNLPKLELGFVVGNFFFGLDF